jgi:hypothetical protein
VVTDETHNKGSVGDAPVRDLSGGDETRENSTKEEKGTEPVEDLPASGVAGESGIEEEGCQNDDGAKVVPTNKARNEHGVKNDSVENASEGVEARADGSKEDAELEKSKGRIVTTATITTQKSCWRRKHRTEVRREACRSKSRLRR